MKATTVLLADAARARIFTVEEKRGQAGVMTPALTEQIDLIHPGRREPHGNSLANSRPGSQRGAGSGHAVDDHRDAKLDESDRRFASDVMAELSRFCTKTGAKKLLVCAPARFMGHLRDQSRLATEPRYVALDISSLTAPEAFEHLSEQGLLD